MTASNDTTICVKRCTKCGEEKPATTEHFHKHKNQKSGLRPDCKVCCRVYKEANKEHARQVYQERYQRDKETLSEKYRQWRLKNSDYDAARHRAYYLANKEKENEDNRQYRIRNRERLAVLNREYREQHREQFRVYYHQHRARKRALPDTFTAEEWQRCLTYWNNHCAVCSAVLIETHADHWIPLNYKGTDNPGTVATNMICLCSTCNLSKHDTLPEAWLTQRFGNQSGSEILYRISTYFEWVKLQSQ